MSSRYSNYAPVTLSRRPSRRKQWLRLFLVIFIVYALFMTAGQQAKLAELTRQKAYYQRQIEMYRLRNQALQQRLSLLNDEKYIEKLAREQLGLIKPGEIQYRTAVAAEPSD